MHKHNRRSGKASVWIAWLTTLVSIIFIVLIVNRDALQKDQAVRPNQAVLAAQGPPVEALVILPLPEIDVSVGTVEINKDDPKAASYQTLYAKEAFSSESVAAPGLHTRIRTPPGRPTFFSGFESAIPSVDIVAEAAPKLTLVKPPDLAEATAERVTGGYDTSPSVAALERRYRTRPKPVQVPAVRLELRPLKVDGAPTAEPFTSERPDADLAQSLQDTRVRLYLSEFKIAIYEGQSRASLRDAWKEVRALLEMSDSRAADLRALGPDLKRIEQALSGTASAHNLIGAVDALRAALDANRQPLKSDRVAGMKPF